MYMKGESIATGVSFLCRSREWMCLDPNGGLLLLECTPWLVIQRTLLL
jgi:hypothetical protein